MLSQDNIARYSSTNQDYGAATGWRNPSHKGPGKADLLGKSLNELSSSLSLNAGGTNGNKASSLSIPPIRQPPLNREGRNTLSNIGGGGGESLGFSRSESFGRGGSISDLGNGRREIGFNDPGISSLVYKTGEPLGSLSAGLGDTVKTMLKPSREEMKLNHVNALTADNDIGCLPGYTEKFARSKYPFNRGNSNKEMPVERVPSAVTRAQEAIGKTREEIGAAQDIIKTKAAKISGMIPKNPRGDPWINASTPGPGQDSFSIKKYKQNNYRKELEAQMEQSKQKKIVEKQKEKEGINHPLGPNYNSHYASPYSFQNQNQQQIASTGPYVDYLKAKSDTVGTKAPARPSRLPQSDYNQSASPSTMNVQQSSASPWLDEDKSHSQLSQFNKQKRPMGGQDSSSSPSQPMRGQASNQQPLRAQDYTQQPMGRQNLSQNPYMQPVQQQQMQGFIPPTQFYSQPQPPFPFYTPYAYPYPPQMPQFPVYQPQMPQYQIPPMPMQSQTPQFAQRQPDFQMRSENMIEPKYVSPEAMTEFVKRQEEHIKSVKYKQSPKISPRISDLSPRTSPRKPTILDSIDLNSDNDVELDEEVIRHHVWQTSDQLPSEDLKKAMYKTELKKQILEKRRQQMEEKAKEAEMDEKLEQSIREYQLKMQQQIRAEQEVIRQKQKGHIITQEHQHKLLEVKAREPVHKAKHHHYNDTMTEVSKSYEENNPSYNENVEEAQEELHDLSSVTPSIVSVETQQTHEFSSVTPSVISIEPQIEHEYMTSIASFISLDSLPAVEESVDSPAVHEQRLEASPSFICLDAPKAHESPAASPSFITLDTPKLRGRTPASPSFIPFKSPTAKNRLAATPSFICYKTPKTANNRLPPIPFKTSTANERSTNTTASFLPLDTKTTHKTASHLINFDEIPCQSFRKDDIGGGGDVEHYELKNKKNNSIIKKQNASKQTTTPKTTPRLEASSKGDSKNKSEKKVGITTTTRFKNSIDTKKKKKRKDRRKSKKAVKVLSEIQQALRLEKAKMDYLIGKRKSSVKWSAPAVF